MPRFSAVFIAVFALCVYPSVLLAGDEGREVCAVTAPSSSCPVTCFRADPVCGVDGVTYWCGCAEAACGGVKVAKLGFCGVGNGGAGPVSAQALLLLHIVWLIVLAFFVCFGLF
ncbi:uncharacterized protein LOC130732026 [Lotus japonicus]|uniref:uncharacterized protein LOC130732026 n=1 Tax=Lotus japonicus TaxID=34305 RepID=UPI00258DDDD6|nr:uncharacterized protein LOC130732026 [Lotus japonicus]